MQCRDNVSCIWLYRCTPIIDRSLLDRLGSGFAKSSIKKSWNPLSNLQRKLQQCSRRDGHTHTFPLVNSLVLSQDYIKHLKLPIQQSSKECVLVIYPRNGGITLYLFLSTFSHLVWKGGGGWICRMSCTVACQISSFNVIEVY